MKLYDLFKIEQETKYRISSIIINRLLFTKNNLNRVYLDSITSTFLIPSKHSNRQLIDESLMLLYLNMIIN